MGYNWMKGGDKMDPKKLFDAVREIQLLSHKFSNDADATRDEHKIVEKRIALIAEDIMADIKL